MDDSFAGGSGLSPEEQAAADEAKIAADEAASEGGNASGVAGSDAPAEEESTSEESGAEESDGDAHDPAADHAPVATEAQEAIIGDQGKRSEQQPVGAEGTPTNVNQPLRSSAPPPESQSGVPLPEDRAAGVQPGE